MRKFKTMERGSVRMVNQEINQICKGGVRKAKGKYELRFAINVKNDKKNCSLGMSEQEESQGNGWSTSAVFGEDDKKVSCNREKAELFHSYLPFIFFFTKEKKESNLSAHALWEVKEEMVIKIDKV